MQQQINIKIEKSRQNCYFRISVSYPIPALVQSMVADSKDLHKQSIDTKQSSPLLIQQTLNKRLASLIAFLLISVNWQRAVVYLNVKKNTLNSISSVELSNYDIKKIKNKNLTLNQPHGRDMINAHILKICCGCILKLLLLMRGSCMPRSYILSCVPLSMVFQNTILSFMIFQKQLIKFGMKISSLI